MTTKVEPTETVSEDIVVCLHCHGNLSRFDELLYAYVCKDIECDLYNILQLGILWEEK